MGAVAVACPTAWHGAVVKGVVQWIDSPVAMQCVTPSFVPIPSLPLCL